MATFRFDQQSLEIQAENTKAMNLETKLYI